MRQCLSILRRSSGGRSENRKVGPNGFAGMERSSPILKVES